MDPKELEDLKAENAALKEENEVLTSVNEELQAKVAELSDPKSIKEAVEKKEEKLVLPTDTFEVEGVKYKFVSPVFTFKKKRVIAADALLNDTLLAELVSINSSVITEA